MKPCGFGLVNKVVPAEQVLSAAETYATMILGNSQQAIRSGKRNGAGYHRSAIGRRSAP